MLKVFGALLRKKNNLRSWEEVMQKMNWDSVMDERVIFECLRISYDDLPPKQQDMFLDIACTLLGHSKVMAECVWKSHGWSCLLGVDELVTKALISVDSNGCFIMHDHLRDMGCDIEMKKERRSRLWMPHSLAFLENNEVCFEMHKIS